MTAIEKLFKELEESIGIDPETQKLLGEASEEWNHQIKHETDLVDVCGNLLYVIDEIYRTVKGEGIPEGTQDSPEGRIRACLNYFEFRYYYCDEARLVIRGDDPVAVSDREIIDWIEEHPYFECFNDGTWMFSEFPFDATEYEFTVEGKTFREAVVNAMRLNIEEEAKRINDY